MLRSNIALTGTLRQRRIETGLTSTVVEALALVVEALVEALALDLALVEARQETTST
jgi:hypothetical protein